MGDRLGGGSSHPGSIDGRSRGEAEKIQEARDLSAKKLWVEGQRAGDNWREHWQRSGGVWRHCPVIPASRETEAGKF